MNATFEVNPLIESLPVTSASIGATNHGINPFFSPFFFVGLQRQSAACFLIRRQRSSRTIAASIKLTSRWSALLPEPEGAAHSAGQSGQWTAQRVLWHAHTHKKKKVFASSGGGSRGPVRKWYDGKASWTIHLFTSSESANNGIFLENIQRLTIDSNSLT